MGITLKKKQLCVTGKRPQWERPSTSVKAETVSKVMELARGPADYHREVVNEARILCGSAKTILTAELWMRRCVQSLFHNGRLVIKVSAAILGGKTNHIHSTATVFAKPHTLWPLTLSQTKNWALRSKFCNAQRHRSNVRQQLYSF